ncbi:MAG: phage portal protein, partial [Methylobacterium sp.]|nr:phage portal protein [Methylobacterium sp.]
LRALVARSREAAQNDDHMAYFLGLVEANLIGNQGISVQPKPRRPGGKVDSTLAKRLDDEFWSQSKRGVWDVTGQLSRVSFDQLGVRTVAQDGEILIRIWEGDPESPTGFAVELIDAQALDIDYNAQLTNGNIIRMGVEMTPRRRPVAYHLFKESPNPYNGYATGYSQTERVRVPASEILHVYLPYWVWGSRGVPWARTALRRLKMLGGYEEAAITAARMAAAKSAKYVANPDVADPMSLPNGERRPDGTFAQEVEPGQIEQVPFGYDLQPLDWQWPNTDHGDFVKAALRGIACGLGVSYNALANDLEGVNYSSLRQGALAERDLWMRLQNWWIEWVSEPIYRRWCAYAIRSGRVTRQNGMSLPLDQLDVLAEASYQGRRWPWVDPLKDLQANELALKLRTKSVSAIIRESGSEPDDVWEELAQDQARLAALGIPLTLTAPAQPAATPQEPAP